MITVKQNPYNIWLQLISQHRLARRIELCFSKAFSLNSIKFPYLQNVAISFWNDAVLSNRFDRLKFAQKFLSRLNFENWKKMRSTATQMWYWEDSPIPKNCIIYYTICIIYLHQNFTKDRIFLGLDNTSVSSTCIYISTRTLKYGDKRFKKKEGGEMRYCKWNVEDSDGSEKRLD